MMHDFEDSSRWSQGVSQGSDMLAYYRRWFPDIVGEKEIPAGPNIYQKTGIDRVLYLGNGKHVTVDEKFRQKDYGDFLCEEWSVFYGDGDKANKVGWTIDPAKVCDFVLWAIVPTQRATLLPYDVLRRACVAHLQSWKETLGPKNYPKDAQNRGYRTRNIAVPWNLVWRAMHAVSTMEPVSVVDPSSPQLGLFLGAP